MKNMSIKIKLMILTSLTIVGFISVIFTTNGNLNTINEKYNNSKKINQEISDLKSIFIGGLMINSATNVFIIDSSKDKPLKSIESSINKINTFSNKLKKQSPKVYSQLKDKINTFVIESNKVLSKARNTHYLSAKDGKKLLKPWRTLKGKMSSMIQELKKENKILSENFENTLSNSIMSIIIIIAIAIILYLIIASFIASSILTGLRLLHDGITNLLTNNNTSQRVQLDTKEELGAIATDFNSYLDVIEKGLKDDAIFIKDAQVVMGRVGHGWFSQKIVAQTNNPGLIELKTTINSATDKLKDIFLDVNSLLDKYTSLDYRDKLVINNIEKNGVFDHLLENVNNLRDAITHMLVDNKENGLTLESSSKVLLGNVDILNKNSNEAAAALEETAAALEEVTSNISNNTSNVIKMASLANSVTSSANSGEELASKTTVAMDEINNEVSAISDAITVIDQISFQTNILSLNAAVEAATAGESGKGFAVVAQEVRNLASRSAEAATEIKNLVSNASSKANEGKEIAKKMIAGYTELNDNISQTIKLISDVELASKEQKRGIEQINDSVTALDSQTQQIASIASETQHIASQTDNIAKLVVTNADEKEFVGKENVSAKVQQSSSASKQTTRSTTKQSIPKTEVSNATIAKPNTISKPISKPKIASPKAKISIDPIVANNDSDSDEWASF